MAGLAQMIDEAAKSGGLVSLTLWRTAEGWQGNVKREQGGTAGWRCMARKSASQALVAALDGPVSTKVVQERPKIEDAASEQDIFG